MILVTIHLGHIVPPALRVVGWILIILLMLGRISEESDKKKKAGHNDKPN